MRIVGSIFALVALFVLNANNVEAGPLKERQHERAIKRLNEAMKHTELAESTQKKLEEGKRLNRRERREVKNVERNVYLSKRAQGQDEVSFSVE